MKFTGTLVAPRIDMAKYRNVLDKHLRETIAQAIVGWLEATVLAEVPVWSGASRATFLALARNIEYNIPIFPVAPSRVDRGMAESSGSLEADAMKGRYVFTYQQPCFGYSSTSSRRHAMGLPSQRSPAPTTFRRRGRRHSASLRRTCACPIRSSA